MICPKCKTEVSDDDVFCPNCNLKLIFTCPKCKSPTHIGPIRCENCGYQLIKLCPKCDTKNFSWSDKCRKCGFEFKKDNNKNSLKDRLDKITKSAQKTTAKIKLENDDEEKSKKQITFESSKTTKNEKDKEKNEQTDLIKPFIIYIDFINLDKTFEKYDKDEFKQKVIQNIKTNVKIAFDADCNFVSSRCVMFKFNYLKSMNILEIIHQFDVEFAKFNEILEKTLDRGLTYKFAITTIDEVRKSKEVNQLKFGSDKDIIVSSGA